jgi:hypothetical protein
MSEAMNEMADALEIELTTTMGHSAHSNGIVEVFWRFWNRCMRLLPDDHYKKWPAFKSRICFAFNTAAHESLSNVAPHEIYFGAPARNAFTTLLTLEDPEEIGELDLPTKMAEAVKVSTKAFMTIAASHDQYVRAETARRLNEKGYTRSFEIGDKVKVRVPPTHEQMLATGRRSKHITAWRGPCVITEKISTTAYRMIDTITQRTYERLIGNILPYRATSAKQNPTAAYDPKFSEEFQPHEFIAIRDAPGERFFIAEVIAVSKRNLKVTYYGSTNPNISKAKFRQAWHLPKSNEMTLRDTQPTPAHEPYSGNMRLNALKELLVARHIKLTKTTMLDFRSKQALAALQDELFVFD